MTKAIIFDFDGVLVDTMPLHFKTWEKLALILGYELNSNIFDELRGASREKSLNLVLDSLEVEANEMDRAKYSFLKDKWYQEEIAQMDRSVMLEGALDLLEELDKSPLKLAVASASRNAKKIIDHLSLAKYFDVVLDASEVLDTKPDPSVFIQVIKRLQLEASEVVIIEDSPLGIRAAKELGAYCIAIGDPEKLNAADEVLNSVKELDLRMLEQLKSN